MATRKKNLFGFLRRSDFSRLARELRSDPSNKSLQHELIRAGEEQGKTTAQIRRAFRSARVSTFDTRRSLEGYSTEKFKRFKKQQEEEKRKAKKAKQKEKKQKLKAKRKEAKKATKKSIKKLMGAASVHKKSVFGVSEKARAKAQVRQAGRVIRSKPLSARQQAKELHDKGGAPYTSHAKRKQTVDAFEAFEQNPSRRRKGRVRRGVHKLTSKLLNGKNGRRRNAKRIDRKPPPYIPAPPQELRPMMARVSDDKLRSSIRSWRERGKQIQSLLKRPDLSALSRAESKTERKNIATYIKWAQAELRKRKKSNPKRKRRNRTVIVKPKRVVIASANPKRRKTKRKGKNPLAEWVGYPLGAELVSSLSKSGRKRKRNVKRRRNGSSIAQAQRKEFAGHVGRDLNLFLPESAPKSGLSTLGPLVLLKTERGTIKPSHGHAYVVRDARGKLWLASSKPGANLWNGPAQDFGRLRQIEYKCRKPHLGEHKEVTWYHRFESPLPHVKADGKGGLLINGGSFKIQAEGIVG